MLPLLALQTLPIVIKGVFNIYLKFYKKINVTMSHGNVDANGTVTVYFGYMLVIWGKMGLNFWNF